MKRSISGKDVIKILIKYFDFKFVGQKGSHIKLSRFDAGRKITTIVPNHKELAYGTLRGVLRLAQVEESDFWKASK